MNKNKFIKGFTIVELMTVVALVAVVAVLAVPSFNNLIKNNRLVSLTNDFVSSISAARNEAISKRTPVIITPTDDDWSNGWVIFVDEDRSGGLNSGDLLVRRVDAYPSSISVSSSPGTDIAFTARGMMNNLAGWGALKICDDRKAGRTMNIAGAGNVTITKHEKGTCS